MSKVQRFGLLAAAIAAGLGLAAADADAASIGVNFSGGQTNAQNVAPLASSDLTGAVQQMNWNNAGGDGTTGNGTNAQVQSPVAGVLVNSNGAATTAAISWTSTNSWSIANSVRTPAEAELLNGYLDNTNAATPTTITMTGIPYARYDVYAYVGSDGNARTGHVSITNPIIPTSTFYFSTNSNNNPPTFVQATATDLASATAATYAKFTSVTGSTFTLTNTRDAANVGLHAIQIVDTTPVPEPVGVGMLAVGGVGLLARRRRHP